MVNTLEIYIFHGAGGLGVIHPCLRSPGAAFSQSKGGMMTSEQMNKQRKQLNKLTRQTWGGRERERTRWHPLHSSGLPCAYCSVCLASEASKIQWNGRIKVKRGLCKSRATMYSTKSSLVTSLSQLYSYSINHING